MNPIAWNILAVIAGVVGGSVVNMVFVQIGPHVVPLPKGADTNTKFREHLRTDWIQSGAGGN